MDKRKKKLIKIKILYEMKNNGITIGRRGCRVFFLVKKVNRYRMGTENKKEIKSNR